MEMKRMTSSAGGIHAVKESPSIVLKKEDGYPSELFATPNHCTGMIDRILIPNGLIQDRITALARDIAAANYIIHRPLIVVCVLKGAYSFFADLVKRLKREFAGSRRLEFEFIRAKSYENDQSIGHVSINLSEAELSAFRGKDLLLVEDIVDTGKTIVALLDLLKRHQPASVRVASLLRKQTPLSNGYCPDYIGFTIPDLFVVGYGLDYNETFRDLDHIGVISETGKKVFKIIRD